MKKLTSILCLLIALGVSARAQSTSGTVTANAFDIPVVDPTGTFLIPWFVLPNPGHDQIIMIAGVDGVPYSVNLGPNLSFNYMTLTLDAVAPSPTARSFTNNASHAIQTVAASANGFQLSTTRDAQVSYSVTISSATQIGVTSNVSGYVVLEICSTNSSTAANWQEIARVTNGNQIGLAVALALTATGGGPLVGVIPAGYYTRLRSVSSNGTPTFTYNSGQEVLE